MIEGGEEEEEEYEVIENTGAFTTTTTTVTKSTTVPSTGEGDMPVRTRRNGDRGRETPKPSRKRARPSASDHF